MQEFWTHHVPHMGLSRNFVLHLVLALAAFHLAYLASNDKDAASHSDGGRTPSPPSGRRRSRQQYLSLAQQHFTTGLAGFSAELAEPNGENCGSLYLGAVLTSYCTFAAGPTTPEDLLVGTANEATSLSPLDGDSSGPWMPFVHGVRLMHESFSPDVLFSGPMAPMGRGSPRRPLEDPVCVRDGFPRLDWEAALRDLRAFIAGCVETVREEKQVGKLPPTVPDLSDTVSEEIRVCLRALDRLIGIYAATYGRQESDGKLSYQGPGENQFVFGWLYTMEQAFVSSVRRREPCSMLVLAYFAVLLNSDTLPGAWYIEGWRQHIIETVLEFLVEDEYRDWMRWPVQQIGRASTCDASTRQSPLKIG